MSKVKLEEVTTRIGAKIKELRISYGYSQKDIGKVIGVSHQQIQKVERGIDRISAGAVSAIADKMGLPVHVFFTVGSVESFDNQRLTLTIMREVSKRSEKRKRALLRFLEAES